MQGKSLPCFILKRLYYLSIPSPSMSWRCFFFFFLNHRNCICEVILSFSIINQGPIVGYEIKIYVSDSSIKIKFDFWENWSFVLPLIWIDSSVNLFSFLMKIKSVLYNLLLSPLPHSLTTHRLGEFLLVLGSESATVIYTLGVCSFISNFFLMEKVI